MVARALLLAIPLAALAAPARAEGGFATASLEWRAPARCPQGAELAAGVDRALDRTVFVTGDADLIVEGRVESAEPGFVAHLEVRRRGGALAGRREVRTAGPCAALAEPLALVLALVLDVPRAEVRAAEAADAAAETAAEGPPTAAPPPPDPTPVRVPVRPPSPWSGDVGLGGGLAIGALPDPTAVLALELTLRFRWLALRATAVGSTLAGTEVADGSAETFFVGAGLALCGGFRGAWGLDGCLEGHWRRVHARGEGFSRSRGARADHLFFGASVRVDRQVVGPLRVFLTPRLLFPTRRVELVVREPDGSTSQLHRSSFVHFELLAGLGVAVGS